jgi:hypothetical protein
LIGSDIDIRKGTENKFETIWPIVDVTEWRIEWNSFKTASPARSVGIIRFEGAGDGMTADLILAG